MEQFHVIKHKLNFRYKSFRPTFIFIRSKFGLQLLVRLCDFNIEILVSSTENFDDLKIKFDSFIIIAKNRKNESRCQCGFSLDRFNGEHTKCKICGLKSCVCCHFTNFKINKGQIICPKCHNSTSKKIKSISTFQRIFNKTLTDYSTETGEKYLLELVGTI